MSFKYLLTNLSKQGILTITLNRPDKLNTLTIDLLSELNELLTKISTDNSIHGIILTGAGKVFCAGADINRLAELNTRSGYQFAKEGQTIFRKLEQLGKPSLAAINGVALGGGCELIMSTSIRIANDSAKFGQPEVKLGVIPGYGGTQRLARLIGKGRALDLCLTGRFINAQDALQFGLISEITSAENLLTRAEEIMQTILNMGPIAIRSVLEVIDRGYDMNLEEALELEAAHFGLTCGSVDKSEGTSAFLEKRAAKFKNE